MKKIFKYLLITSIVVTTVASASIKENTQHVKNKLIEINKTLIPKDQSQEIWTKAHADYLELYEIKFNALTIDERPKEFQKFANEVADKINKYFVHSSENKIQLKNLTPTNVDGKTFISEGKKLLKQARNEAAKQKKLLKKKKSEFVGASSTGEKANELYEKSALEFLKAGKTFNANKKFNLALDSYVLTVNTLKEIGRAPLPPYVFFIDDLKIFDAKTKANKMAIKGSIKNFGFYNTKEDAKHLLHWYQDPTAKEFITNKWAETNRLFFNKSTLEAEIKALKKTVNIKSKKSKNITK